MYCIVLHMCKPSPFSTDIEIRHAGRVKINSTNEDSKTTVGMMDIWYLFSVELGDESPKQPVTRQVSLLV